MRAIDADAISYESIDSSDTGRHEHYYGTGIIAVRKEDIDAMPTIQPEPKRGRWIYKTDLMTVTTGYWECSECKEGRLLYEENFCPHCGADMREVTE